MLLAATLYAGFAFRFAVFLAALLKVLAVALLLGALAVALSKATRRF